MLFSSITFLIYFLPCMVLVYFLAPGRMKNTVLLLGSLIFYGWGEPKYLPVMAAVILAGYLSARLIGTCQNKRQSKILLAAAVLLEIFPLIYCKYADFFIQNLNVLTGQKIPLLSIAMPLSISFYTFQLYGRCIPGRCPGTEKSAYVCCLCCNVSAARCGADRALFGYQKSA